MKKIFYAFIFLSFNLIYSQQFSNKSDIDVLKIVGVWKQKLPESKLKLMAKNGMKLSENLTLFWKYEKNGKFSVKMPRPDFNLEKKTLGVSGFDTSTGIWKLINDKIMLTYKERITRKGKEASDETTELEILCLDDENMILKSYIKFIDDYHINEFVRIE